MKIIIMVVALLMPAIAFSQNYTGRLKAAQVVTDEIKVRVGGAGYVKVSTAVKVTDGVDYVDILPTGFVGNGSGLTNLTPGNISAGSLPSNVIASSIALNSVQDGSIVGVSGSKVSGNISGNAANITGNLAASQVAAGSLGSGVIASSLAVNAVYTDSVQNLAITDAKINDVAATKLTGTISNDRLDDSSVTLQGNTFNGASQLVKLGVDGKLPVLDGSNLTGITAVAQYKSVGGYNGTLGAGTTFFTLVPTDAVTVSKIIVTITESGEAGSTGSVWKCGSTAGNALSVTSTAGSVPGTVFTAAGTKSISAGVAFGGWMDATDEVITPSANVVCEYK